jgi:hypothetical protein
VYRGPVRQLVEEGNLFAVKPGDSRPRVAAKGYVFDHINVSRDGRFFVADVAPSAQIVAGSVKTGRCRMLCDSGSTLALWPGSSPASRDEATLRFKSSPNYTHPHPYFSPDCAWVIFNSYRTGSPQVYAAAVPEGFLEELEA